MQTANSPSGRCWLALWLAIFAAALRAEDPVLDPRAFDLDGSKTLDEDELALYIIKRDKLKADLTGLLDERLHFVKSSAHATLEDAVAARLRHQATDGVFDLEQAINAPASSYSFDKVLKAEGIFINAVGVLEKEPGDKQGVAPGVFGEAKKVVAKDPVTHVETSTSYGPILLRKSRDDWSDALDDVAGATVSYARNRLKKQETRSTEGALIYPIKGEKYSFVPSVSWKLARIKDENDTAATAAEEPKKGESDELKVDLPIVYATLHDGREPLYRSHVELSVYALTDSRLRGLVAGSQLSWRPYVYDTGTRFALNTGYKGIRSLPPLRYRFGLVPLLDFNRLYYESRYIEREDHDDRFSLGANSEFALKTKDYPALELVLSHKFLKGLNGSKNYSDLFTGALKVWFTANAGLSLERQRGETPVAEKEVDSVSLNFELKF